MNTRQQINRNASTKLEKAVARELISTADGNDLTATINDLLQHGCQSGMIGSMIYHTDTLKFYRTHRKEIETLLKETMDDLGTTSIKDTLRDWDTDDPFCRETHNQNLLAWFAFEETARRLSEN